MDPTLFDKKGRKNVERDRDVLKGESEWTEIGMKNK